MGTKDKSGGTGASGESHPASAGSSDRNSIDRARPRERKRVSGRGGAPSNGSAASPKRPVNSISAAPPRRRQFDDQSQVAPTATKAKASEKALDLAKETERSRPLEVEDRRAIPEHVLQRFVQVGRKYYFPDGARAFTDRGQRLTTPSENSEVIRSLVSIAKARGWGDIVVRGTDSFRREAWFAAKLQGLEVRGYRPSDVEQARLVRTLGRNTSPAGLPNDPEAPPPSRARSPAAKGGEPTKIISGRLLEHGRAPFQQDPRQPMSYFAKLETEAGERVIWGVDLERAFKESVSKPRVGDVVGLRSIRQDSVTVKAAKRDKSGSVIGEQDVNALRNRWLVEKSSYYSERRAAAHTVRNPKVSAKDAVRADPALAGTYLQIRAAELAAKRIRDPKDQAKFVSEVRTRLAETVGRGDPPSRVKMRERTAKRVSPKIRGSRVTDQAAVRS